MEEALESLEFVEAGDFVNQPRLARLLLPVVQLFGLFYGFRSLGVLSLFDFKFNFFDFKFFLYIRSFIQSSFVIYCFYERVFL